jgi:hypothetical protein
MPREALSVWLDDRRPPPDDGWTWVETPAEAIALLEGGAVERLSLDHDLGIFEGEREVTGNAVIVWLEEAVAVRGVRPPASIAVHSANPPAHEKMQRGIDAIARVAEGTARESAS